MPFQIINKDITKVACDAIVNPTDSDYSGSGGTDYAIHMAAGPELDDACSKLPHPLHVGEAVSTPGFNLPCKYIIHTTGPRWSDGLQNEPVLLRSCYINSLMKAHSLGAKSVAFPLISSGTFGFPKDKVLRIATDAISDYLYTSDEDIQVYICIIDRYSYEIGKKDALEYYLGNTINDYSSVELHKNAAPCYAKEPLCKPTQACGSMPVHSQIPKEKKESLRGWLKKQDDTFPVMLFKLIDKKGMTDVECYKRANVTKGTFYKIRSLEGYKPSKATVLAFAIALELTLDETNQLLKTVGFTLSHSNIADMIVEFYIKNGIYDIFEINAALYQYDQVPLGC